MFFEIVEVLANFLQQDPTLGVEPDRLARVKGKKEGKELVGRIHQPTLYLLKHIGR